MLDGFRFFARPGQPAADFARGLGGWKRGVGPLRQRDRLVDPAEVARRSGLKRQRARQAPVQLLLPPALAGTRIRALLAHLCHQLLESTGVLQRAFRRIFGAPREQRPRDPIQDLQIIMLPRQHPLAVEDNPPVVPRLYRCLYQYPFKLGLFRRLRILGEMSLQGANELNRTRSSLAQSLIQRSLLRLGKLLGKTETADQK